MTGDDIDAAIDLLDQCRRASVRLATAESCTGGMIGAALTAIAGSSDVVECGFITYSNEAKHDMLGVPMVHFETVGAVSEAVARAMAEGAVARSRADIAVSVTGIAGPGGGTETKPVGLVHMAVARHGRESLHERHVFDGDRDAVRQQTVTAALALIGQGLRSSMP